MLISKNDLKQIFHQPLSPTNYHLKMAPAQRAKEMETMQDMICLAKQSAVLILLFPENEQLKTVFIQRSEYEGAHSGQISFPGGKKEAIDKGYDDTALRETYEEIGVESGKIEIIGQLSDLFIPLSNFLVKAFVGYCAQKPEFVLDKKEVQSLIKVPIEDFFKENVISEKEFVSHSLGIKINAPFYRINNVDIWGATAMIMSELLDILKPI